MADSKKYDGSTWEHSLRKLTTATDTITTLPVDLYADVTNATAGLVGNMQQTGTPTPQNPIQPSETGERTANLFDGQYYNAYVTANGEYVSPDNTVLSIIVKCEPNTQYTIKQISPTPVSSHKWRIAVFTSQPINGSQGTVLVSDDSLSESTIITMSDSKYLMIYYVYSNSPTRVPFMINTGSTALPYEPYGYKLDIKSANTTTPVYLGEVQTTRRVKKLVLTGEENITSGHLDRNLFNIPINDYLKAPIVSLICTHYIAQQNVDEWSKVSTGNACFYIGTNAEFKQLYIRDSSYSTIADFKSYLSAQYAAGTPVTVWYVLAELTTGIVNEPLCKIGDYADTVSVTNIPTTTDKDTFDVLTTLKPSEVSLTYTGWHDSTVKEWDGSEWQ